MFGFQTVSEIQTISAKFSRPEHPKTKRSITELFCVRFLKQTFGFRTLTVSWFSSKMLISLERMLNGCFNVENVKNIDFLYWNWQYWVKMSMVEQFCHYELNQTSLIVSKKWLIINTVWFTIHCDMYPWCLQKMVVATVLPN